MIEVTCKYCGKTFSRYPSQVTSDNSFCSRKCCNEWQAEIGTTQREQKWNDDEMMDCPHDDCSFESGSMKGLGAHWGMKHDGPAPWNKHTCDWCGDTFIRADAHIRGSQNFCNNECNSQALQAGEVRDYAERQPQNEYGKNWPEQRRKAIERDGGTCTYEGCEREECTFGARLHVHHIKKLKTFDDPEKANKLDNLRTLCAEHHGEIERRVEMEADL